MGRLGLEKSFDRRKSGGLKRLLMFTLMGASLTLAEKLSAQSRAGAELLEAKKNMRIVPVPEPSGYTIEFPDPAFADSVANMQNILPGFFPGAEQYPDNVRNMREVLFLAGIKSKAELEGMSSVALLDLYMANDRKDIKDALNQPEVFNRFAPLIVVNSSTNRWGWDWAAMTAAYQGGLGANRSRGGVVVTGPDPGPKPEAKPQEQKPKPVTPPPLKPAIPPPAAKVPEKKGSGSILPQWLRDYFNLDEKKPEQPGGAGKPPVVVKPPVKREQPVPLPPEQSPKSPEPEKREPSVWDNIHKPTGMGWERAAEEVLKAKSQNRKASAEAERAYSAWQDYFDAVLQTITVKKTGEKLSIDYLNGLSADPNAQLEAFKLVDRYLVSLLTKKPGQPDLTPQEREAYSIVLMWERAVMEELKKDLGIK